MSREELRYKHQIERLDIKNPDDVRLYEEGFYRAFIRHSNPGIRSIWIWNDEAKRLKTKIPYEDQAIFFVRSEDRTINTAVALNIALKEFQSEAYGFQKPPQDHKWAEGLTLFNMGAGSTGAVISLMWQVSRWVITQGYDCYYITSAERAAKFHKKIGAEQIAKSETLGVTRYFFRQSLQEMKL